jgi:hypothetical protein
MRGRGIVSSFCIAGGRDGRNVKEVYSVYVQHHPTFQSRPCDLCLDELGCLVDFYAITALSKYEILIDPSRHPVGIFLQQIPWAQRSAGSSVFYPAIASNRSTLGACC